MSVRFTLSGLAGRVVPLVLLIAALAAQADDPPRPAPPRPADPPRPAPADPPRRDPTAADEALQRATAEPKATATAPATPGVPAAPVLPPPPHFALRARLVAPRRALALIAVDQRTFLVRAGDRFAVASGVHTLTVEVRVLDARGLRLHLLPHDLEVDVR